MSKVNNRIRRARKVRAKIAEQKMARLSVHRTNANIYAQIIDGTGAKVLATASSVEADVRKDIKSGSNIEAATLVGKRIADKAKASGIADVAFDRSGFKYHGRIKALADAARENGLKF